MGETFLKEFFAITWTSVYLVKNEKDENGVPIVEKIALGKKSEIPVGGRVGKKLRGNCFVGVTKAGIWVYLSDKRQRIEEIYEKPEFKAEGTSPIIALCLDKEEAIGFLNSEDFNNYYWKSSSVEWGKIKTRETLKVIGENHPLFIISASRNLQFDF